jgi:hypothetical protein
MQLRFKLPILVILCAFLTVSLIADASYANTRACAQIFESQKPLIPPAVKKFGKIAGGALLAMSPLSPLVQQALAAGGFVVGGGFGVRENNKIHLLDTLILNKPYEKIWNGETASLVPSRLTDRELVYGWKLNLKEQAPREFEIAKARLQKWRATSPAMVDLLLEVLDSKAWHGTLLAPKSSDKRTNVLGTDGHGLWPFDGREVVQVAVNELATKKIYLVAPRWREMDEMGRAALLVHEAFRFVWLQSMDRENGFTNAERRIVGRIMLEEPGGRDSFGQHDPFYLYYESLWGNQSAKREVRSSRSEIFEKHPLEITKEFREIFAEPHPVLDQVRESVRKTSLLESLKRLQSDPRAWSEDNGKPDQRALSAASLEEFPTSKLMYWLEQSLVVDLLWQKQGSKIDQNSSNLISWLRANTSSSISRELIEIALTRMDHLAAQVSVNAASRVEFLEMAHGLTRAVEKLHVDGYNPRFLGAFESPAKNSFEIPEPLRSRLVESYQRAISKPENN